MSLRIYTIGHSNLELQTFVDLLKRFSIETVVDVRSQPYSQYSIQYNREPLKAVLNKNGLEYLWLGDELGGRPDGEEYYDEKGRVLYGKYSLSNRFKKGISTLLQYADTHVSVLLCSEENPAVCHRNLLIGRYLTEHDEEMLHLRSDGSVQTDSEINSGLSGEESGQIGLFSSKETLEWKSIRSVSLKKAPKSFLPN